MEPFERMEMFVRAQKPPPVKFTDLEAVVTTRVSFNLLPFDLRADFLRITDETALVPITLSLRKKDLTFREEDGVHHATVKVFGRLTTLGGRIVQTFEDVIQLDVPASLLEDTLKQPVVYQKALPMRSGLYKMNLVVKDLNSGNIGTLERRRRCRASKRAASRAQQPHPRRYHRARGLQRRRARPVRPRGNQGAPGGARGVPPQRSHRRVSAGLQPGD
jgi:hypothetical protein